MCLWSMRHWCRMEETYELEGRHSMDEKALLTREREWLHREIIRRGVLAVNADGIATNADKGNKPSRARTPSLPAGV